MGHDSDGQLGHLDERDTQVEVCSIAEPQGHSKKPSDGHNGLDIGLSGQVCRRDNS